MCNRILLLLLLLNGNSFSQRVSMVVAADGSGDYRTLTEALANCKHFSEERITIRLKPGTYREKIEVGSWLAKISLIGEDAATTIITFDDYSGKGSINTFTSFTFKVSGNDFFARNITFENAAGAVGQAVAVHVEADRCVFVDCRFIGNQDTVYSAGEVSRHYFQNCYIEGTTDFIFGSATALFENCHIHSKKNSYITAASTNKGKEFGFVFRNCRFTADENVSRVYLGRPWRNYARTVFVDCELGRHILPEGWHNWNRPEAEHSVFYAELNSRGEGANPRDRVTWSKQLGDDQRYIYSADNVLTGSDNWKPQ